MILIFLTGFLQVFLVSANTRQIAQGHLIGSFLVGMGISLVWAYNVHHIAVSDVVGAFVYATGAGLGTVAGIVATRWWYRPVERKDGSA